MIMKIHDVKKDMECTEEDHVNAIIKIGDKVRYLPTGKVFIVWQK